MSRLRLLHERQSTLSGGLVLPAASGVVWSAVRSFDSCGGIRQPGHHHPCLSTQAAMSARAWGAWALRTAFFAEAQLRQRDVRVGVPQARHGRLATSRLPRDATAAPSQDGCTATSPIQPLPEPSYTVVIRGARTVVRHVVPPRRCAKHGERGLPAHRPPRRTLQAPPRTTGTQGRHPGRHPCLASFHPRQMSCRWRSDRPRGRGRVGSPSVLAV